MTAQVPIDDRQPEQRWVTAPEGWEFVRQVHPELALPPGKSGLYNYFRNRTRVRELHTAGAVLMADRGHYLVKPRLFADLVFNQSTRRDPVPTYRSPAPNDTQSGGG
jgi:hypothetical protein